MVALGCLAILTFTADAQPPVRPKPPAIKNRDWIQIPLDAFILYRLEAEQLTPAPEATRPDLLRRLTLALVGRPATQAEIDAFVKSTDKRAYEKTVDRLLTDADFDNRFTDIRSLARKDDPATARDIAKLCWQKLFDQPLANSAALEWLACELIDPTLVNCCDLDNIPAAWDVKHLVRAIAVSATYRQSASDDVDTMKKNQVDAKAQLDAILDRLRKLARAFPTNDKSARRQAIDEMILVFESLGERMTEIIGHFDAAAKHDWASDSEIEKAYVKHREIVVALRDTPWSDSIQTLDQAAGELESHSRAQNALLTTTNFRPRKRLDELRIADRQKDIQNDVLRTLKFVLAMKGKLPEDDERRIDDMTTYARERRFVGKLVEVTVTLGADVPEKDKARHREDAIDLQAELVADYALMAGLLRGSKAKAKPREPNQPSEFRAIQQRQELNFR